MDSAIRARKSPCFKTYHLEEQDYEGERVLYLVGSGKEQPLDLSDESAFPEMLARFVDIKSEADLMEWASDYGLPFRREAGPDENNVMQYDDLTNVGAAISYAQRYRTVLDVKRWAKEGLYSQLAKVAGVWYDWQEPYGEQPEFDSAEGRRNLKVITDGKDPFARQRAKSKHQIAATKVCISFYRDGLCGSVIPGIPLDLLLKDWKSAIERIAFVFVARSVTDAVRDIRMVVDVVQKPTGRPQLLPRLDVDSPINAVRAALFSEATQSELLRICPHPSCGKMFFANRKDRLSCGREACKKYVTKTRKEGK